MKIRRPKLLRTLLVCLGTFPAFHPSTAAAFESGRASFSVTVNGDLVIPYRVFAVYVLPGERFRLTAAGATATANRGSLTATGPGEWQWTAPADPGVAELVLETPDDRIQLNALILHPAGQIANGRLNGYSIGSYPAPLRGNPFYNAPDGFFELNEDTADIALSPNFRLAQFPSKQSMDLPRYLVLREDLLLKLELLLEHVNNRGIATDSFTVMSGYRTPNYNRAIGNGQHSRHIYGGAADIYIDVSPCDDIMDDLNRDGAFDYRDAQFLYRLADELFSRPENAHFRGGLGVYRSTSAHGPFLHVDARGFRARWGLLP
ncbi:MAG TPA: D-Ala-D-Ala carboxypeptidase family metallohydrolase [Gammaproteobacteria bacterium]|nr:D-Ala-D-Ala carboxypeptidase family metallohydrolase [Gammaproteobacteria bacterium]